MVCTLICGTTTLSRPDSGAQPQSLDVLPRLPRDAGGPVFAEPWQAEAFALAVRLSAQGHFTWQEWAATLATELAAAEQRAVDATQQPTHVAQHPARATQRSAHATQLDAHAADHPAYAPQQGATDDGSLYYQCWLTALEHLVVAKGLADPASLLAQKEAWAEAYRTTPHGLPVALRNTSEG
jgi:hypothetical protein